MRTFTAPGPRPRRVTRSITSTTAVVADMNGEWSVSSVTTSPQRSAIAAWWSGWMALSREHST